MTESVLRMPKYSALIMAAGTGGHIMPGLAIATELDARQWAVQWLGSAHGMETKLVPRAGLVLNSLRFSGVRGKGVFGAIKGIWQMCFAFIESIRIMRRVKPDVVIGMGGYICVPGAMAAKISGIPIVLVNADADLLLSNRRLSKYAKTVCCGFDGNAAKLRNSIVTGNPVRASITKISEAERRFSEDKLTVNILVVGGSLGAQVLNETVPAAMALLSATSLVQIQHQTGIKQVETVQAAYDAQKMQATVMPFIEDMAKAYEWADVVICRSGAITVSELCAAGVPAIVIPFLASTTQHQDGNAQFLENAGAGIRLPQSELSATSLAAVLQGLNRQKLMAMAKSAKALGKPNATKSVADIVEKTIL
jgi:UDP-N-acetylglucosamine--N-acetylmuramyl-(pentapeptide) pyrophosphoryl-undecaprenol N-acetylglucosamine transferase